MDTCIFVAESLHCSPETNTTVNWLSVQFSSLSRVRLFATPWIAARQASLSISNSQSLLKHMSIESMMPSSHLILCRPLLLLPPIPPSIRVFSNESTLHMSWPRYSSFSFSISPSNEHPGLISFRMDWLDLLAVQGTLKTLLQHHSSIQNKKLKKNSLNYLCLLVTLLFITLQSNTFSVSFEKQLAFPILQGIWALNFPYYLWSLLWCLPVNSCLS